MEEEEKARKEAEKQAMWNRYMDKMRVARREIGEFNVKFRVDGWLLLALISVVAEILSCS